MGLLQLNELSYQYEGTKKIVLQNISVVFEPGKVYAIVGKSGAGKSTLLSLISGLDVCVKGKISYNSSDLKSIDRDKYRAKSIGVIFQSFNLINNAAGIENIVLSMNISGVIERDKKSFAYALLEKVGIDKKTADRKVLKLSGGEQQRVAFARALAHNPDIIIADEPTGNLDTDTENAIMEILVKQAHEENKCVIIVTHSKRVSSAADEIWEIQKGRMQLIEYSRKKEVK